MSHVAVWKWPVPIIDVFEIDMPKGARILSVQVQRGEPQVWGLVDPSAPKETRTFVLLGTGNVHASRLIVDCDYVGTFQIEGGALVFHLFAVKVTT